LAYWDRLLGAVVVIAANAGGAWTPIGDVTTTMLWIHGQLTTFKIMQVSFFTTVLVHWNMPTQINVLTFGALYSIVYFKVVLTFHAILFIL
jgi:Na+/H+ antiporter NhaD/arsenite permease-like protein